MLNDNENKSIIYIRYTSVCVSLKWIYASLEMYKSLIASIRENFRVSSRQKRAQPKTLIPCSMRPNFFPIQMENSPFTFSSPGKNVCLPFFFYIQGERCTTHTAGPESGCYVKYMWRKKYIFDGNRNISGFRYNSRTPGR